MYAAELRAKTIEELKAELLNKKKELTEFYTSVLQNKEKNVKKAVAIKKEIARINTVINEKKFTVEE